MLRIEDFEIVRELGHGGMGVVYEAIERPFGRRVALKILSLKEAAGGGVESVREEALARRFSQEATSVARLSHPSISKIYDFGRVGDKFYLALEYLEAPSLSIVLEQGRIPIERAIHILLHIANALSYAHDAGVVHRDVHPGNVLLMRNGTAILCDFGLATTVNTGPAIYSSLEQRLNQPASPAMDVYALGVLAFQLIKGQTTPFVNATIALLREWGEIFDIDLPQNIGPSLTSLVGRMLDENPEQRPTSRQVLKELEAIRTSLEDGTDEGRDASATSRMTQPVEVRATYVMGGRVVQQPLDDELVYFEE